MAKTSTNLEENVASALCYVLGWVTGLIFYLLEKDNRVVRFHAMQSIIVFGTINVAAIVLGGLFLWIIGQLLGLLAFVLWIILIIKAYQGGMYKLPIAGDLAENWTK